MTGVFSHPAFDDHERVLHWSDRASGLRAIVAIHRVRNGRAVGGCRARDFASDDEALTDVLRLSRGMTYKTALAGLPYGGAKAVILGRPTPEGLRAFGRAVDSLGGDVRHGGGRRHRPGGPRRDEGGDAVGPRSR